MVDEVVGTRILLSNEIYHLFLLSNMWKDAMAFLHSILPIIHPSKPLSSKCSFNHLNHWWRIQSRIWVNQDPKDSSFNSILKSSSQARTNVSNVQHCRMQVLCLLFNLQQRWEDHLGVVLPPITDVDVLVQRVNQIILWRLSKFEWRLWQWLAGGCLVSHGLRTLWSCTQCFVRSFNTFWVSNMLWDWVASKSSSCLGTHWVTSQSVESPHNKLKDVGNSWADTDILMPVVHSFRTFRIRSVPWRWRWRSRWRWRTTRTSFHGILHLHCALYLRYSVVIPLSSSSWPSSFSDIISHQRWSRHQTWSRSKTTVYIRNDLWCDFQERRFISRCFFMKNLDVLEI
jgi:hypothetical protein